MLLVVAWAGCALYVILCLVWPSLSSSNCELIPGSSVFGREGRSWLPPGSTCEYDLHNYGVYVTEPPRERIIFAAFAIVGLPIVVRLKHLLSRRA